MCRVVFLMIALVSLTACEEYQGRQTNCFSKPVLSFAAGDTPQDGCGDWVVISD